MIADILTIIWKELHEMIVRRPNYRGGWLSLLIVLVVFGIFIPVQNGPEWVTSPVNLAVWGWVPYLLVGGVIADSFAGERERHTLETLLASRLSDRAILLGKICAALVYGWGITLASILIGLITINIVHGRNGLLFYPAAILAATLMISFLVALLAAGLGILISLRAATARQAQQTVSTIFLVCFIPLMIFPLLPAGIQQQVSEVLSGLNTSSLVLLVIAGLVIADAGLVLAALRRFQRARLILD